MKHLLTAWEEISQQIEGRDVMLFLDYDGTLAPIAAHPGMARLSPCGKEKLKRLARGKGVQVAIISGRALDELKKQVGIPGLIYAGNHGLEFEGPGIRHEHPAALEAKEVIKELVVMLTKVFRAIPGVWVEYKILTVSIHYRQASPERVDKARTLLLEAVRPYLNACQIVLSEGKKVWELRPAVPWNKGSVVLWLLGRALTQSPGEIFPIYIGDDRTDEDAFKAVQRRGLGVRVAENAGENTAALYYLRSPDEVFEFLDHIHLLKEGAHA